MENHSQTLILGCSRNTEQHDSYDYLLFEAANTGFVKSVFLPLPSKRNTLINDILGQTKENVDGLCYLQIENAFITIPKLLACRAAICP